MGAARYSLAALSLLVLVGAGPPADPPKAFGAREGVLDVALSPSGRKVAFITPGPGQATILYTVEAAGGANARQALSADGRPERLAGCGWVSEERLVCTVYMVVDNILPGQPIGATRLVAVNADGSNLKLLSRRQRAYDLYVSFGGGDIVDWLPGSDGAVLMGRQYVPEGRSGTHMSDDREGYGVDRIDTASLSSKTVEPPRQRASDYISDGRGTVRIMASTDVAGATGYDSGKLNYYYRTKASRDWKPLGTYNVLTGEGFYPIAVDPDLDVAYGYKEGAGGRRALYSVALDGSKTEKLVFAHPAGGRRRHGQDRPSPPGRRRHLCDRAARGGLFRRAARRPRPLAVQGASRTAPDPLRRFERRREQAPALGRQRHRSRPLLSVRQGRQAAQRADAGAPGAGERRRSRR